MRLLPLAFLVLSSTAFAKPWQGIEPGASKREAVVARFGLPSKTSSNAGKEVLVYKEPAKGAQQVQFQLTAAGTVDRIVVFPSVKIDRAAIETGYGQRCEEGPQRKPCYLQRKTPAGKVYLDYPLLGLIVFFDSSGDQVESLLFKREMT